MYCVCLCCAHATECGGGQRTNCRRQLCPSLWTLGMELRLTSLVACVHTYGANHQPCFLLCVLFWEGLTVSLGRLASRCAASPVSTLGTGLIGFSLYKLLVVISPPLSTIPGIAIFPRGKWHFSLQSSYKWDIFFGEVLSWFWFSRS